MGCRVDEIASVAKGLRISGFNRAVLVGMGGSSLCPEVVARTFGTQHGLDFRIADSTAPQFVRHVTEWALAGKTVYVIASKSGSTIEVQSLFQHFYESTPSGDSFVAITDPGTALEALATEREFRHVFTNPADIGGRFSALSCFGLVPAAFIGVDIAGLLDTAATMAERCRLPVHENPGALLGAYMAAALADGRDKMYLQLQPPLDAFAPWIEQLIAESTGKSGTGVLPVPVEGPESARGGPDRWAFANGPGTGGGQGVPTFRVAGPSSPLGLGAEFFRWEFATGVAAHLLDINAFDEPNVTEAKEITGRILRSEGEERESDPNAELWPNDGTLESIDALFETVGATDYVALLAFLPPAPTITSQLSRVALAIARRTGAATTVGIGPRYLHSTGQLHKGGPDTGVFLVFTCAETVQVPIPGEPHSFSDLFDAQAMGDVGALRAHNRRVLHCRLRTLDDFISLVTTIENRYETQGSNPPPSTGDAGGV